jgi:phage tail-like protein
MAVDTRKADSFYQTVNFYFRVQFNAPAGQRRKVSDTMKQLPSNAFDIRFQSVSGLDSMLDTETIKEGGENRFEHVVPVRRKYGPLVLKRGLLSPSESKLTEWIKNALDNEYVEPVDTMNIFLLNEEGQVLMGWVANNVWPRSWKIGELNAERGEVLIETLELNYNRLIFREDF